MIADEPRPPTASAGRQLRLARNTAGPNTPTILALLQDSGGRAPLAPLNTFGRVRCRFLEARRRRARTNAGDREQPSASTCKREDFIDDQQDPRTPHASV